MKRFKSLVMVVFSVVFATTYAVPPALAAPTASKTPTASSAPTTSSTALSIAPKKNYVIEQGKSVKDKLTIRNLDNTTPLDLTLRVVDFTFTDDGGTPKLFLAPDAPQTTWSLKPFLSIPESVVVPAGGTKSVDMSVAIPKGHGAGSYYSAILYGTGAPNGGNVGLSASGVTLVFTQIPGKVNEDLKLQKLGAYAIATPGTPAHYMFLTMNEPQTIAYTLKNSGNVVEAPAGNIKLKSMFGHEYDIQNVNPNGSLALIGQSRTFTACIKLTAQDVTLGEAKTQAPKCDTPGLWPGLYTVSLDVFYGQNGNTTQELTGTATFWYLPAWFIILLVVLILIIAFVIWRLKRKYNDKFGGRSFRKTKRSRK